MLENLLKFELFNELASTYLLRVFFMYRAWEYSRILTRKALYGFLFQLELAEFVPTGRSLQQCNTQLTAASGCAAVTLLSSPAPAMLPPSLQVKQTPKATFRSKIVLGRELCSFRQKRHWGEVVLGKWRSVERTEDSREMLFLLGSAGHHGCPVTSVSVLGRKYYLKAEQLTFDLFVCLFFQWSSRSSIPQR